MATITLPAGTDKVRLIDDDESGLSGVALLVAAALLPPKATSSDGDGLAFFLTVEKIQTALMERVRSGAFGLTVPPLPVPEFNPTAAQLQNAMMTSDDLRVFAASYGVDVVTAPALSTATAAPVVTGGDRPAPLPAVPNWKMLIQTEATAHCLRLRKAGANPTRNSILDSMAQWCRDNDIKTDTKINPSANYLRTHVLGGKHWEVPA